MSNTLTYQVTQKYEDINENVYDKKDYTITKSFTQSSKFLETIISGSVWNSVPFGNLSTATHIRINTNQTISIKLNSGSEELTVTSDFILSGSITALSIMNNSGSTATVEIEIFG